MIQTIVIEDSDRHSYRSRLNTVLNRYQQEQLINIDTGMVHDGYDSRGCTKVYYYAIIIVKGVNEYEEM